MSVAEQGELSLARARSQRRTSGLAAVLGLLLAIPGFVFVVVAVTVGFGLSLSFAGMLLGLPLLGEV